MEWLNLKTSFLHDPDYMCAEPHTRGIWLNLVLWCVEHETNGVIHDCRDWPNNKWLKVVHVTRRSVMSGAGSLWRLTTDGNLQVAHYPSEHEAAMRANNFPQIQPPQIQPTAPGLSRRGKSAGAKIAYAWKLKDPRWQRRKTEILTRDDFTCRDCKAKDKTLHVHHLRYSGEPWDAPSDDLITLCLVCHEKRHGITDEGKPTNNA